MHIPRYCWFGVDIIRHVLMRKIILFIFLALSAQFSSADTYPATPAYTYIYNSTQSSTLDGLCSLYINPPTYATFVSHEVGYSSLPDCEFFNSSGSLTMQLWSIQKSTNYSCPHGGTVSVTNCVDAPACPSGQSRNSTTGECQTVKSCKTDEYNDTPDSCAKIPNCNITDPNPWGSTFNVTTKACEVSTNSVTCSASVDGSQNVYCQGVDDCKPLTYICSNKQSVVDSEQAARAGKMTDAKTSAQNSADNAAYAAEQAASAALKKAEEAQIAATEESQARVKAMDLDNQLTAEQRAQAELDFSESAKKSVAAETKVENSNDAAKTAETAAGNAGDASAQAGASTNPGNAEVWSGWADEYNKQAGTALDEASSNTK